MGDREPKRLETHGFEEFVLAESADDEAPPKVEPAPSKSRAELEADVDPAHLAHLLPDEPPAEERRYGVQFTLAELMIVVTIGATGLALAPWLQHRAIVFGTGLATLAALMLLDYLLPQTRFTRWAWIVLVTLYVAMVTGALWQQQRSGGAALSAKSNGRESCMRKDNGNSDCFLAERCAWTDADNRASRPGKLLHNSLPDLILNAGIDASVGATSEDRRRCAAVGLDRGGKADRVAIDVGGKIRP